MKNIYEHFKGYTKEEVDFIISKLDNHDKDLISLRYGSDLHNPDSSNWKQDYNYEFYNKLLMKISRLLKSKREGKTIFLGGKSLDTIYQRFKDYQKEDISYAISILPSRDREILHLRYGNDFDNPDISNWDKKYSKEFKNICSKIKNRLENIKEGRKVMTKTSKVLTIYQIFKNYTKEEINKVIYNLDFKSAYLIGLRYGSDLHNPDTSNWNTEYSDDFYDSLLPKMRRRLEANRRMEKGQKEEIELESPNHNLLKIAKETLEKLKMEEYSILLEKYSIKEILSYVLVQNIDGTYNIGDIVRFFGLDRKMVLKMATKVLNNMQKEDSKIKTK